MQTSLWNEVPECESCPGHALRTKELCLHALSCPANSVFSNIPKDKSLILINDYVILDNETKTQDMALDNFRSQEIKFFTDDTSVQDNSSE